MKKNNKKIAIIGFGRFGQLFAEILLPFGEIFVVSSKKIKDARFKQIKIEELINIDWVIPAVPISKLEEVLRKIRSHLKPGSIVTDVCSVKEFPCRLMQNIFPKNIEIVGTHPMFGPDSAKNGLKNLQIVLCPLHQKKETLNWLKSVFSEIGLDIIETTPKNHDLQVAKSLSLVHFIGRGLEKMDIKKQEITTLGFDRLLTVCETVSNDSWQLFYDMQKYNPYAKKVRSDLLKALDILEKEIV
uniref:Prephenate dehydrogenase/arogenate dehydrogenase family protein n=1 Tax=candidate division CPR3 bacterium TaxID=2268181 RepID=A0A7C4M0Z2_UNCC3